MTDTTPVPPPPPTTGKRRRWPWIVGVVVALFAGIGIGAASTTTEPPEPRVITEIRKGEIPAEDIERLEQREQALDERAGELDDRKAELDERAAGLDEREAAITETEEQVAANTVTDGVWTVGVDIEPGTYRATDVSADCYWAVLVSGTNGAEIVNNGIPGGGSPTVTVEEGHDFESQRCGEWVRQ